MDWITFSKRISLFGSNLKFFGKSILNLLVVISVLLFWFFVFNFYEPYQEAALFMLKLMQVGIVLFVCGYLTHYLFYFINELIIKHKMKKIKLKVK